MRGILVTGQVSTGGHCSRRQGDQDNIVLSKHSRATAAATPSSSVHDLHPHANDLDLLTVRLFFLNETADFPVPLCLYFGYAMDVSDYHLLCAALFLL